jgi:hypothetical protein
VVWLPPFRGATVFLIPYLCFAVVGYAGVMVCRECGVHLVTEFFPLAGEVMFVPSLWHHCVLNLSDTVAVTHNYASRTNLAVCRSMLAQSDPSLSATWEARLRAGGVEP